MDGARADHDQKAVILLGEDLDGRAPAVGDHFFGFGRLQGMGELNAAWEDRWVVQLGSRTEGGQVG